MHGDNFKFNSESALVAPCFEISPSRELTPGPGVQIRPFRDDDAPALYTAARESLDDLCAWMTWCRRDYGVEHARSFIASASSAWNACREFSFAIVDGADGAFLGSVGISQINRMHNLANLGYWVRRTCIGRGIASMAVPQAAKFAFQHAALNRLELLIPVGNNASRRVALKAGAHEEGILRNRLLLAGKLHDAILYSLIPEDLQPQEQHQRELVMLGV